MIVKEGLPTKGELVLCTVKRLLPHCAFVSLDEYGGKEGMLHINEVSLKGVRDIKDNLFVDKILVCKVLDVNEAKGEVDLSLKRVKPVETNKKLNDVRLEKRIYKLIEYASKNAKVDVNTVITEITKHYISLVELHEDLRVKGIDILNGLDLPKGIKSALEKQFNELIEQMKITVTKVLTIKSEKSDGLRVIKELLNEFTNQPEISVNIKYLGAPKYAVTIGARNYKIAEQVFSSVFSLIESKAKQLSAKVGLLG